MAKTKLKNTFDSFAYLPIVDVEKEVGTDLSKLYSVVKPLIDSMNWEVVTNSLEAFFGVVLSGVVFWLKRKLDTVNAKVDDTEFLEQLEEENIV